MTHDHDGRPAPAIAERSRRLGWPVGAVLVVTGVSMLVFGFWGWLDPESFAEFTAFPVHVHYLHDAGVFQIGIGVSLLAALVVSDAIVLALGGFFVANTLHTLNHGLDLAQGGHLVDIFGLGGLSVLSGFAIVYRIRRSAPSERRTR